MKIEIEHATCFNFGEIQPGEVFGRDGKIYIKTTQYGKDGFNAANIYNGQQASFDNGVVIHYYPNAALRLGKES